jgi:hypothetical protein
LQGVCTAEMARHPALIEGIDLTGPSKR